MAYTRPYPAGWKDLPDRTTPVTAEALNTVDAGISAAAAAGDAAIKKIDGNAPDGSGNVNLSGTYVSHGPAPSGDATGATDTPALQAWLNGLGSVTGKLPEGTYYVKAVSGVGALSVPAGTQFILEGAGADKTIIKVAQPAGDYLAVFEAASGTDPGRVEVRDLTIDQAEPANTTRLTQANIGTNGRVAIYLNGASGGVLVERVRFKNFDSANTVLVNGLNGTVGRTTLHGCEFLPVALAGSNDHDHSTVYWQATPGTFAGCEVTGCAFLPNAAGLSTLGAAIETHGPCANPHDNLIHNYPTGMQLSASTPETCERVHAHDNQLRGVAVGVQITYPAAGQFTGDAVVDWDLHDNLILIDRDQWWAKTEGVLAKTGAGFVVNQPPATANTKGLKIHHNIVRALAVTDTVNPDNSLSAAVVLYRTGTGTDEGVAVTDNRFVNLAGTAVYINTAGTLTRCAVEDNEIVNVAGATGVSAAVKYGVTIYTGAAVSGLSLSRNRVADDNASPTIFAAALLYCTTGPVTGAEAVDNVLTTAAAGAVMLSTNGATGLVPYVRYRAPAAPTHWAKYGSVAVTPGGIFIQSASPDGATWTALTIP